MGRNSKFNSKKYCTQCGLELKDLTESQINKKRYVHSACRYSSENSSNYYKIHKKRIAERRKMYESIPSVKAKIKQQREKYTSSNSYKEKRKKWDSEYAKKHPQIYRDSTNRRRKLGLTKVNDVEVKKRKYKRDVHNVTDYYVKKILKNLGINSTSKDLLEVKREQIKLKRKIYEKQRGAINVK